MSKVLLPVPKGEPSAGSSGYNFNKGPIDEFNKADPIGPGISEGLKLERSSCSAVKVVILEGSPIKDVPIETNG